MTELEIAVSLNLIGGIGPVRVGRLVEKFGGLVGIARASEADLEEVWGIGAEMARAVYRGMRSGEGAKELEAAARLGVKVVMRGGVGYPVLLQEIPDPPVVLYTVGSLGDDDRANDMYRRTLAIVGSRACTLYGREIAREFGRDLAGAGWVVVSGLARGIDTEAHIGAMEAVVRRLGKDEAGKTVAVLGSGMRRIYPPENAKLARRIVDTGGVVMSEFPLHWGANKTTFPLRNRLVSGMSRATLVIEAPARSGSLITAELAGEQGRPVYAVPGLANQPFSQGCHQLIREGATLVTDAGQILEDFGWMGAAMDAASKAAANSGVGRRGSKPDELGDGLRSGDAGVLEHVARGYDSVDLLVEALGRGAGEVMAILARLEMAGVLNRVDGGRYRVRGKGIRD